MENKIHTIRKENNDYLEIGTPKNGIIKVYGDFMLKEEFKAKLDSAVECKNYAILKINGEYVK